MDFLTTSFHVFHAYKAIMLIIPDLVCHASKPYSTMRDAGFYLICDLFEHGFMFILQTIWPCILFKQLLPDSRNRCCQSKLKQSLAMFI